MTASHTALRSLSEQIARREFEWSWSNLDPKVKSKFVERMNLRLPWLDPETEWESMTLNGRQELAWHLTRTPQQLRTAWEEDCHRLKLESDEATEQAFRVLMEASS